MNLTSVLLAGVLGIFVGLWFSGFKDDPLTRFEKCVENQKCVVTRYEYTPYQGDPRGAAAKPACPMYRLPILQAMPLIGEISNEIERQPSKGDEILLGFIERALNTNVENTTALDKSYGDYLRACGIDPDATLPLPSSKDGSDLGSSTPKIPNVGLTAESTVNDESAWMYGVDFKESLSSGTEPRN